jgi:hypothetical protein
MFFDPNYLIFMIPALIISVIAQIAVKSAFSKWKQVRNSADVTGVEAAKRIMQNSELSGIQLKAADGRQGDHYDPRNHSISLTPDVAQQPSIASMAIAAHELGHAQQKAQASALFQVRSFLVPAAQIGSGFSYLLIIAGLLLQISGLVWLGVIAFAATTAFMVVTLPVELDASRRAKQLLNNAGLLNNEQDREGVDAVLRAAALTYVAAMVSSILNLLYYISLASGGRRRR